jgi:hypothetical protein
VLLPIYHEARRRRPSIHSAFSVELRSTFQLPHSHTCLPSTDLDIKIVQNDHKNSSEPPKSDYLLTHLSLPLVLLISWVFLRDPSDPVRPDRHVSPSFLHMLASVVLEL